METAQPDLSQKTEPPAPDEAAMTGSPVDSIIARVKSYMSNPKLVTTETLADMLLELHDLKDYVDTEDQIEPPTDTGQGLAGMMGKGGYEE